MVDLAWTLSTPVFFLALSIMVCGLFATGGGGDYGGVATRLQRLHLQGIYRSSEIEEATRLGDITPVPPPPPQFLF